ncbi:hypothetical protein B296_00002674 [Ensete ventricosum]|uniref:Uncharacterized protein n=1 Tax=Ensete ventricosum TaxID=4639 RepID=A0A427AUK3_ENSVE|nr:hypothetical protein B296_00002674 [Ensete ventricosum]
MTGGGQKGRRRFRSPRCDVAVTACRLALGICCDGRRRFRIKRERVGEPQSRIGGVTALTTALTRRTSRPALGRDRKRQSPSGPHPKDRTLRLGKRGWFADRDANSGAATAVGEHSSSIQNAEARR